MPADTPVAPRFRACWGHPVAATVGAVGVLLRVIGAVFGCFSWQ